MRKLQIEDAEVMRIAIQQEIARSEESRYDHRLHGLLLVSGGQSRRQVAELFGEDDTTVQRWVRRFAQGGLDCDGPMLSEQLHRRYGVDLGVHQCQRLFRQIVFRLRMPRPRVAQADPLKIAAVKKTPPPGATKRR